MFMGNFVGLAQLFDDRVAIALLTLWGSILLQMDSAPIQLYERLA